MIFRPRSRRAALFSALSVTAAMAVAVPAFAHAGSSALTASSDPVTHLVALNGDLPVLTGDTDLGPTHAGRNVQVLLSLTDTDSAAEQQLETTIYQPGSADYHQFLTPAEYAARFGTPIATWKAVTAWATRDGLRRTGPAGSRLIVDLDGTVAQIDKTFGITLHSFETKAGKHFYANPTAPMVPAAHDVEAVIGLDSRQVAGPVDNFAKERRAATGAKPGQQTDCVAGKCLGLTTPQDLWSAYDQPGGATAKPAGNLKVDFGQGQQIALIEEGNLNPIVNNLRIFEQIHHLPKIPVEIVHTSGKKAKYNDTSIADEDDLDDQASTGMAPDARRLVMYDFSSGTVASLLGAIDDWAADKSGPLQMSASYGACEPSPVTNTTTNAGLSLSFSFAQTRATESMLRQAVIEGRTLFASTGDVGGGCQDVPVAENGYTVGLPTLEYPAASPNAVAVGGTVLYTTGGVTPKRSIEYGWTYGGGGTSFVFPKPSYQDGISSIIGDCLYSLKTGSVAAPVPCRGSPDISDQSGDVLTNGYGIVDGGETDALGAGTSLASPLAVGMWTRIQAAQPGTKSCSGRATFKGLGFANYTLYKLFKSKTGSRDFFDIGGSVPTSPPTTNVPYPSTPGWDYQSGMGVMDVSNIIKDATGDKSLKPADPVLSKAPSNEQASSTRANDCTPLFTDPAGDDAFIADPGGTPQLDILAGNINTVTIKGTKMLQTVMVISNLSTAQATGGAANEYYFYWTYNGTEYFSSAQVAAGTSAVTYGDGKVVGNENTTEHSNDAGQFIQGKDGHVVVDVPLAHVGTPKSGATLTAPAAGTNVLVGTSATGGLIETADTASAHYPYRVGQACHHKGGIAAGPYTQPVVSDATVTNVKAGTKLPPIAKQARQSVKATACKHSKASTKSSSTGTKHQATGGGSSSASTNETAASTLPKTGAGPDGAIAGLALLVAAGVVAGARRRRSAD